jgi:pimeloyl-ACP methyl ester carboxylesterase
MTGDLTVVSAGATLRARIAGDGPAVLLLHGLGEDLDVWWERRWVDALAPRCRVIAFDARGHGRSSKPRDAASYGDRQRVADAIAILDAAQAESAVVAGYSMGGWTAMSLACAAPGRVRALVAGGAPAIGQSLEALRRALAGGLRGMLASVERQCGALPGEVLARFLANDAGALAAACTRDRPSIVERLAAFEGPALLYAAERDPLRPAIEASAAALAWPCHIVPGCDHFDLALRGAALPLVVEMAARAAGERSGRAAAVRTS